MPLVQREERKNMTKVNDIIREEVMGQKFGGDMKPAERFIGVDPSRPFEGNESLGSQPS